MLSVPFVVFECKIRLQNDKEEKEKKTQFYALCYKYLLVELYVNS